MNIQLSSLLVAVDLSGSHEVAKYWAELKPILKSLDETQTKFCVFDSQVIKTFDSFSEVDQMVMQGYCGGGTDMQPVLELAQNLQCETLCVITDGMFPKIESYPNMHYTWLLTDADAYNQTLPGDKIIL